MKRLTYRVSIGGAEDAVLVDKKSTEECLEWKNVLKRLAYYEDLEEQGLLLKLPCRVGDIVYVIIDQSSTKIKIIPCRVGRILIENHGIEMGLISEHEMIGYLKCHSIDDFGKTIFLTQAEAEEALKGMEEKKK